jgi:hypothetical protein
MNMKVGLKSKKKYVRIHEVIMLNDAANPFKIYGGKKCQT